MIKGENSQQNTNQQTKTTPYDVKALNATTMLLSQKIGLLVRNEKVLSQNILILNTKLKKLDEKVNNVNSSNSNGSIKEEELDTIKSEISELYNKIKGIKTNLDALQMSFNDLNKEYATKSELKELKYLVDAINPLEFVTYKQLKNLLKK